MSTKVEDFFITPLEAHFESQPTEGGRQTILEDMEQYSSEDLNTAVEWLKRARQAQKTFPSPKECIKAIKAVVGGRSEGSNVVSFSAINAGNYARSAQAYCAGMTVIPVIHQGEPQWDEWLAYWRWLGCTWVTSLVEGEGRKSFTVPTHFPSQFDPRFQFMNMPKRRPVGSPESEENAA